MNPITKACAHYLSNFPGSFSTDAGINIFNFTDPASCIRSILHLEVYQHAGVPRCQFHTLIKEFLKHIQQGSHLQLDMYTQTLEKFSWSYHYSQVLANASQFYTENVQIITALENDIHNIKKLFEMLRKGQLTNDSVVRVGTILCKGLLSEVFSRKELNYSDNYRKLFLFLIKS